MTIYNYVIMSVHSISRMALVLYPGSRGGGGKREPGYEARMAWTRLTLHYKKVMCNIGMTFHFCTWLISIIPCLCAFWYCHPYIYLKIEPTVIILLFIIVLHSPLLFFFWIKVNCDLVIFLSESQVHTSWRIKWETSSIVFQQVDESALPLLLATTYTRN